MKSIYTVEHSDYGDNAVYGSFTDPVVAQKLCDEVNHYFSTHPHPQTAYVGEVKIYEESDPIYRYRVYLSITDKEDMVVEKIAPTYQPTMLNWLTLEVAKEYVQSGNLVRTIIKYGTTEQEAKEAALAFYNQLEEHNLIQPLVDIIHKRDNAMHSEITTNI